MPIKSRTETTTGEWLGPTSEEKICNSVPMPSSGCKLSFPLANRSGNKSTLTSPVRIKPTILVFWLGSRHSSKDRRESGWTTVLGSTWLVLPEFQSIPGIGFLYVLARTSWAENWNWWQIKPTQIGGVLIVVGQVIGVSTRKSVDSLAQSYMSAQNLYPL